MPTGAKRHTNNQRAACVTLGLLLPESERKPEREISRLLNIPRASVGNIQRHVLQKRDVNGGSLLDDKNLAPFETPGRPKLLDERDRRHLIKTATRNRVQRFRDWSRVRSDAGLTHVSPQVICNALHEADYRRHSVCRKKSLDA